jgi:AraC-like DNA-binding protein/quercetin dioxygenase-like cupin family protein
MIVHFSSRRITHAKSPKDMKAAQLVSNYGAPSFWLLRDTKTRAFTAETLHRPSYPFMWHYHPEWEIVFSRRGSGTRHVGNSVEKFGPGDLTMLPGNVPHTWCSSTGQDEQTCSTVIHFLPEVWGESFWSLPEVKDFHALSQRALRGVRFTGEGVEEVGQRMEALAAKDDASLASLMELWAIFNLLTKLEATPLNAVNEGSQGRQCGRLDDLLAWLESHLGEPITQQEAAARVKMSPAAFCRWFKMHMGCVFSRYLNEIRVAKVCALITHKNMSISEAAFHAGYNNLSNFNRRFLEVTGHTPKKFRDQLKAKPLKASA